MPLKGCGHWSDVLCEDCLVVTRVSSLEPFLFLSFSSPSLFKLDSVDSVDGWIDEDAEGRGQENVDAIFGLCLVRKRRENDSHHDG